MGVLGSHSLHRKTVFNYGFKHKYLMNTCSLVECRSWNKLPSGNGSTVKMHPRMPKFWLQSVNRHVLLFFNCFYKATHHEE